MTNPLRWPEHVPCCGRGGTGFERTLYRDDCARVVACSGCGRMLDEPATAFEGGVAMAYCDRCGLAEGWASGCE